LTLPLASVAREAIPQLSATGEDTEITALIARADSAIAAFCGFPPASAGAGPTLESATYTEYLDGPSCIDPQILRLRVRPLGTVTSVHDDRDRDWSYGSADLVDSGDYTVDDQKGHVVLHTNSTHGSWSNGTRILKVIYTAGFDTGASALATWAIIQTVAHWWNLRPTAGVTASTVDGDSETLGDRGIPEHVRAAIQTFVLPEAGLV